MTNKLASLAMDHWVEGEGNGNLLTSAVTGEPGVNRATWIELRDHATFPADSATRERPRLLLALPLEERPEAALRFRFARGGDRL
mgnify:CR=1 FL=1